MPLFAEVLEIIKCFGISQASLARDLGMTKSYIPQWRTQGARIITIVPVIQLLSERGRFLSRVTFEREEPLSIMRRNGIRISWVAKRLAISRQALSESLHKGLPEAREALIRDLLRATGKEIVSRIRKLGKI